MTLIERLSVLAAKMDTGPAWADPSIVLEAAAALARTESLVKSLERIKYETSLAHSNAIASTVQERERAERAEKALEDQPFTMKELAEEIQLFMYRDIPETVVKALRVILQHFIDTGDWRSDVENLIGVKPQILLQVQRWRQELSETHKALEEAHRDAARLDWLSIPGRSCGTQERDMVMSMHFERKAVNYYINGRYTTVDGDNLRAAIDAAMKADA